MGIVLHFGFLHFLNKNLPGIMIKQENLYHFLLKILFNLTFLQIQRHATPRSIALGTTREILFIVVALKDISFLCSHANCLHMRLCTVGGFHRTIGY